MEGNVTERRLSVAITPLWLDSSATSTIPPSTPGPDNREVTPRPETSEDGLPPNKVQIQTSSDVPRITLPPRHHRVGQSDTNFENTETEELLAMLRETENLEDQGDILQYLVDTQGLDFNTGKYYIQFKCCRPFSIRLYILPKLILLIYFFNFEAKERKKNRLFIFCSFFYFWYEQNFLINFQLAKKNFFN